jgi:NAD(P)-dependent dehydrogenase (short-subunit alcohol dehydrogenase family)
MELADPVRPREPGEDPAALTVPAEIMAYRAPDGSLALRDRVAVVTGGASGIGLAAARALAASGASVVIAGRRERELQQAAAMLRDAGATVEHHTADVTRSADVAALTGYVTGRFGRLDIAFNNAGYQEPRGLLASQDEGTYTAVFDANVRSTFLCMAAQLDVMVPQGGGVIINNTSVSGIRNPNKGLALYSASKAAAISLTRSAALEYAPLGVRVNAIAPGRVVTGMMLNSKIADMASVASSLPLGRMGNPVEVANLVTWLATDAASYIIGQAIGADGGFLAS